MPVKASLTFLLTHPSPPHTLADKPDYWPSSNSSSSGSSTNIGAIIGGTVGGTAALLFIFIAGYSFLHRRRQYRRVRNSGTQMLRTGTPMTNMHARFPSGPSIFSPPTPPPMSHLASQPKSIHTGAPSILSSTAYSSFGAASPPPTDTASFLTTGNTVAQHTRPIPMI